MSQASIFAFSLEIHRLLCNNLHQLRSDTNHPSRTNSNSGSSLDPRLVQQIYYELGSSVSTSLKTAGQFPA
ncbi:hypothetical protein T09_7423 [Trichinella sp. T9]|nr:hypothetical protein T09_11820 [Trichinella sp. T9]KRX67774.1 hypothetical protein T09_7423 [Trichinella sp. T9]